MMCGSLPLLLVALTTALAAPSPAFQDNLDNSEQIIVPQKRAALVLDRLLIALQKALHEDNQLQKESLSKEWPRTEPLRIDMENVGDMKESLSREWPRTEQLRIDMEDVRDMDKKENVKKLTAHRDHYEEVQPLRFEFGERALPTAAAPAPRIAHDNDIDTSGLQRRGQGGGRGRVLRCYFNAVTCF